MPYIDFNKKKIFYQIQEANAKKALILIHGSGGSSNTWKFQLPNIKIEFDVIAIDLPSHAKSDMFSELTLELYIDVVKKLIESLNYEDVILCGHSLGGSIVQSYYFKYPNDVKALILCGTGGRLRVSPVILESLKNDYQAFLDSTPVGAFYRRTSKEIIDNYMKETSKIPPEVTYQDFSICDKFDILDKMGAIDVPCLILCGTTDKMTPIKYSQYSHDKIKTSELVLIAKAGHMVMLERPNEVNKAIESFVEKYL